MAPLMTKLSTVTSKNVTLVNFWNTFDELNTQRDAVMLSSRLTLNEALSEPTWSQARPRPPSAQTLYDIIYDII